jgi:hypothetical protein
MNRVNHSDPSRTKRINGKKKKKKFHQHKNEKARTGYSCQKGSLTETVPFMLSLPLKSPSPDAAGYQRLIIRTFTNHFREGGI